MMRRMGSLAVKTEPGEDFDEVDHIPLRKRMKVLRKREMLPKSFAGQKNKRRRRRRRKLENFQEKKAMEPQTRIMELEGELVASTKLAMERLVQITKLQSLLDSVTCERDTYKAEYFKCGKENSCFRRQIKYLKKQVHKRTDLNTSSAEVEALQVPVAAWPHMLDFQAIKTQQTQWQIHADWEQASNHRSKKQSRKKEMCPTTFVLPTSAFVPETLPHVAVISGGAPVTELINQPQMGLHDNVTSENAILSHFEMQPSVDNFAVVSYVRGGERNDLDDFSAQGVSAMDSTCFIGPTHMQCDVKVKEERSHIDLQVPAEEKSVDTLQEPTASIDASVFNFASEIIFENLNTCAGNLSSLDDNLEETQQNGHMHSFRGLPSELDVNTNNKPIHVKLENSDDCFGGTCQNSLTSDKLVVKVKEEILNENCVDDLDHVPLQQRIEMLISRRVSDSNYPRDLKCLPQPAQFTPECGPTPQMEGNFRYSKDMADQACGPNCGTACSVDVRASAFTHPLKQENSAILCRRIYGVLGQMEQKSCPLDFNAIDSKIVQTSCLSACKERKKTTLGSKIVKATCLSSCQEKKKTKKGLAGKPDETCAFRDVVANDSTRPRKKKKTLTDSVETALEEDAPGLLQVLVAKGIQMDEIKLYGGGDDDELIDISNEDGFEELEAVISKLFAQSSTLLKFAPVRQKKESRTIYCLACLVSLVEQTRHLQFQKWPVEWGWCRDLHSFIFVFERHNRIVLERPEYGYATYFFELVGSFPIDWQIRRLITAMKLSSCGRLTLLENKPLMLGEDLTEKEAQVLEEYGWRPNSGLGTMLNYCDRVFHDRKNEFDSSEWRSKIGKLLMDGYDGGVIVMTDLPKKVRDLNDDLDPQIKLEV